MCGIAGQASSSEIVNKELLPRMCGSLIHRGPDDEGEWWSSDGNVGLAHRRLAIIDLSSKGRQPMTSASGKFHIVFNGEIYNYKELRAELAGKGHRFLGNSDTEVILEAYQHWGIDCLTKLNGMFAFAIHDAETRTLFLARDRVGEKPLYFRHFNKSLAFASELKALMVDEEFQRELDVEAFDHFLAYGYVPGEKCILKGAYKLLPGHAATYNIDHDVLAVHQYWQLPDQQVNNDADEEFLLSRFEELLEDSVRKQLLASDVPVGILLSGGVDSSLITAMASRASACPVKTFTVSFPGYEAYDEGGHARLVSNYFDTDHTELVLEESATETLPELVKQLDEPLADHAIVPTYLLTKLVRKHTTVALGGDGGDELFGGYPHYSWVLQQQRIRRVMPGILRSAASAFARNILPMGTRGRNHLIGLAAGLDNSIAHINLYFDLQSRRKLLAPVVDMLPKQAIPEMRRSRVCNDKHSAIRQSCEADYHSTLVDAYLVKVDRTSMLNSLEIRAPFLDYRLIEFAFSKVPDHLKVTTKELKILPRRLAKKLLPPSLDIDRKQGFTMPLAGWFNGHLGAYMESVLYEADPAFFDSQTIQTLFEDQRKGRNNIHRLFALTIFELWRREHNVSLTG